MNKKFEKLLLIISALAGMLLLANIPNFSIKANDKNFWYMTEGEIIVDKTIHEFGTISENGGNVSATFIITNNTKAPIVITKVTASCGCTSPDWTKEPIRPGSTGKVVATFNPKNRKGTFDKSVNITTTGYPERLSVRIKGVVE